MSFFRVVSVDFAKRIVYNNLYDISLEAKLMSRFYFVRKKRTLLIASLVMICILTGVCFFLSYLGYRINSPVSYSQMVLDNI